MDPRYGAKVTGKVGKTTVGFVLADDEAPGKVDATDPAFRPRQPTSTAACATTSISESSIGLVVTDREFMDQHSRVGGIDNQFRLGRSQRHR